MNTTSKVCYKVAGLSFSVNFESDDKLNEKLTSYEPFLTNDDKDVVFDLEVHKEYNCIDDEVDELLVDSKEEGQRIMVFRKPSGSYIIKFYLDADKEGCCLLITNSTFNKAHFYAEGKLQTKVFGLNNALMILFALAGATRQTLLFHSSVIKRLGKGYMFLGKSGTGKSTHTRLWLQYISDTKLLNDDNPAVGISSNGIPTVYGTPWSGKTPCYKNESAEIAGLVRLWQAPENSIQRLSTIQAYAALLPTISSMRWEKAIADGINKTLNILICKVPVFSLRNRPEKEAALMSFKALTEQ